MIEKLARAMFELMPDDKLGWDTPWAQNPEEGQPNCLADVYRNAARACLEALREPSEAMISAVAGRAAMPAEHERQRQRDLVSKDWQAMIDVALERKAA